MRRRSTQQGTAAAGHRRGGYLYIAVLTVATVVSVIGLSAITVARAQLRSAQDERDRYEARILATSAIENGLASINANALWRTTYTLNLEFPSTADTLGRGSISCKLVDPDGSFIDNLSDPAWLYGIGRVGNAVHVHRVRIKPAGTKMVIDRGSWTDEPAL